MSTIKKTRDVVMAGDPELWAVLAKRFGLEIALWHGHCEFCQRPVVMSMEMNAADFCIVCMWCAPSSAPVIGARLNAELNRN